MTKPIVIIFHNWSFLPRTYFKLHFFSIVSSLQTFKYLISSEFPYAIYLLLNRLGHDFN